MGPATNGGRCVFRAPGLRSGFATVRHECRKEFMWMKTAIIASSYRTCLLISRGRRSPQCQMRLQSEDRPGSGAPRLEALQAAPPTPAITRQCSQTFFKILLLTPWLRLPACMTKVFSAWNILDLKIPSSFVILCFFEYFK